VDKPPYATDERITMAKTLGLWVLQTSKIYQSTLLLFNSCWVYL